jgi:hypothetical protein
MNENNKSQEKTAEHKYIELTAEFVDFDDKDVRVGHSFRSPSPQELGRANKQVQKDPERALKNLLLGLIKPDQADAFRAVVDRYPGVATSFANEIYKRMGYDSLGK